MFYIKILEFELDFAHIVRILYYQLHDYNLLLCPVDIDRYHKCKVGTFPILSLYVVLLNNYTLRVIAVTIYYLQTCLESTL